MRALLKLIRIIQEKKGLKGRKVRRINPWNPLSYVVVLLASILVYVQIYRNKRSLRRYKSFK
jgi:hypothetical protein